jgi:hypothetical protein
MRIDASSPALQALSQRFQVFAATECRGSSTLYEQLSQGIAADEDLLRIAAHCLPGQPAPNLFLAAVHFLLLQGVSHPLAAFYPDLSGPSVPLDPTFALFRTFCLSRRDEIIDIISTRRVQTNEVRRCSYLYPAFCLITELTGGRSLALVEIGTSAGLNLLWDRYGYCYCHRDARIHAGDPSSAIQIECALRGENIPTLPSAFPSVASRAGIDLNVVDLTDAGEALWLRALIWPEHAERVDLLRSAVPILLASPPRLLSGDATPLLPDVLNAAPAEAALVVFHTHTVNQFSRESSERLSTVLAEAGRQRQLYRLANDLGGGGPGYSALVLQQYQDGTLSETYLARVDGHGRWVEWLRSVREIQG